MDIEAIRSRLNIGQAWKKQADGWWLEDPELDVVAMSRLMTDIKARLATVTARPLEDGSNRLIYHWDVEGAVINFITVTHNNSIHSIAKICPAASWIEREIHDYFAVNFTGREDLLPLLLRSDSPPGLFLWDSSGGGKS
jgi:hypothetical protein